MEKREIALDLTGCATLAALHERLREIFGFPAHYGGNLDALWDMGCDYISAGTTVRIRGVHCLPEELQAYVSERLLPVLREIAGAKEAVSFIAED